MPKSFFITTCLISLSLLCKAGISDTGNFFGYVSDSGQGLNSERIYPRGRKLLFSMYSVSEPQIQTAKEDGFTAIGPYYTSYGSDARKNVLRKAEKYDIQCLYTVGERIHFHTNPDYNMPSDKEIIRKITNEVEHVADNQRIDIWNLMNEELRYWEPDEKHYLKVATEAIRKADPYNRPIMMYSCNNRGADILSHTVKYLDFSSKGLYCNVVDDFKYNRIWLRWGIQQEIKAIKRANTDALPLATLWMAADPNDPDEFHLIDDWVRHDVYLSLVTGAKGILVWSGYNEREGFEKTFGDYYNAYSKAAKELTGKAGLGRVFLFGQRCNDINVDILSSPAIIKLDYNDEINTYSSVNYADIAYKNKRYFCAVNSSNSPVKIRIKGLPEKEILMNDVFRDSEPVSIADGKFVDSIEPLGVKFYVFSPAQ